MLQKVQEESTLALYYALLRSHLHTALKSYVVLPAMRCLLLIQAGCICFSSIWQVHKLTRICLPHYSPFDGLEHQRPLSFVYNPHHPAYHLKDEHLVPWQDARTTYLPYGS
jgi:hypothetical protein